MPRPAAPILVPSAAPRLAPPSGVARPAEVDVVVPDSVRLEGVTKTYPNGKSALIDVDLAIPSGDFVFLVGPSGAGKSTLIKLLVRDEKATTGRVEVTGTPSRLVEPSVARALALVGLTEQARQRPDQLSGGEMQRTAIARAMVHAPRLIIADEPTGNLDPLISWEIIQLLLRINEMGTTVLMATHDAEVVTALRRRVVALEDGRIVRDEVGGYHREY
jgi:cell division transport system ATP-binding protein